MKQSERCGVHHGREWGTGQMRCRRKKGHGGFHCFRYKWQVAP